MPRASGPEPARNAELMAARGWALTGRRAVPARLLATGFRFAHPDLEEALADLQITT